MLNIFKKKIVTRFAPSPTGFLHVGGLRTALYNYLYAKQNKGKFLLRIEDTDRERFIEGAKESLINTIKEFGLDFDNEKPIVQSERLEIYQKYAKQLIAEKKAYYCFCAPERLAIMREKQREEKKTPCYDGLCKNLTGDEIKKKLDIGEKYVVRLKVEGGNDIKFTDIIRGEVKFNKKDVDDCILLKSDGYPTYHLANIIDDHEMNITHVIRGEEWLPSAPKHILLYQAFGWQIPQFAHLPLLLNPDKSKLSKRQGDVMVEEFLQKGYLKEALLNFVALLGWNPGSEREIFALDELIEKFSLKKVHKGGAVFDITKLDWMNGEYIKKMDLEKLVELSIPYLQEKKLIKENGRPALTSRLNNIIALEQERISKISEAGDNVKFLFTDELNYGPAILVWKKSTPENTKTVLGKLITELENISEGEWSKETIEKTTKLFIEKEALGNGDVLWPMRVALTGEQKSPPPFDVAEALGKEKSIARIRKAILLLQ